jgi:hypothetical protein
MNYVLKSKNPLKEWNVILCYELFKISKIVIISKALLNFKNYYFRKFLL